MTTTTQTPAEALTARQARAELSRLINHPSPTAAALITALGPAAAYHHITEGTPAAEVAAATGAALSETQLTYTLSDLRSVHALYPEPLDLDALATDGIGLLTPEDDTWPETLQDWDTAPVALWYRADEFTTSPLERLPDFTETIAMTGTREMTDYGAKVTAKVATELISYGHTLISGTGYGIEAAALRAALGADNPRSVTPALGVSAGGLDRLYPAGNIALLHQVAAAGLVLSEYAPGAAPTRRRVIRRNELVGYLAGALVVPEARRDSAAVHAVDAALGAGRPVGVVPGSVFSAASELSNDLLTDSGVSVVRCASDVGRVVAYH